MPQAKFVFVGLKHKNMRRQAGRQEASRQVHFFTSSRNCLVNVAWNSLSGGPLSQGPPVRVGVCQVTPGQILLLKLRLKAA